MMRAKLTLALVALTACDFDLERMIDQPRCEPGGVTAWLPDRRCDQPTPAGTVAWQSIEPPVPAPRPTKLTIARGADRYRRFCAACHGMLGDADTPVARDMRLRPPPSLHDDTIIGYPDQRIFDVITVGYGMMPPYANQLVPADRWAVVHYVRVLQRSQAVRLQQLPTARRTEAEPWLR